MFTIGWHSCKGEGEIIGNYTALKAGAKVIFSLGDSPYTDKASNSYGYSTTPVDKDSTVADFTAHHDQAHNVPASAKAKAEADYYIMPDDHEWGGDNWDHSITQANSGTGIGASTQAEVDEHWHRGMQAQQAAITAYADNPTNTDSGAIAEKPNEADAGTPANQYPVIYWRQGYDVNGSKVSSDPHAEFFVIDCMSYRSAIADVDNSSKTMLGANQKAWLKAQMLASIATFKIIVSGKKTHRATLDNSDTWGEFTTERDELLAYIESEGITGVIWISGDKHHPHVIAMEKPTDTYDHLCICACPVGVETNALIVENEIIWTHDAKVVGLLDIHQDYIEAKIATNADGRILSRWRLNAGENKWSQPVLSVAI